MKVITIMADSLRRDHVGVYGSPPWGPVYTPNLDRFAREAAVFDNAYVGSFPTVPNRRDTHLGHADKGLPFNRWRPLDSDEVTFPALLAERGIPSMLVTDTANGVTRGGNLQRDYTAWVLNRGQEGDPCWMDAGVTDTSGIPPDMTRYPPERWAQTLVNRAHRRREVDWFAPGTYSLAIDWLEKNASRKDFFLWIDTFDPHEPWDPPEHYVSLYDPGYRGRVLEAPPYGLRRKMGITDRELRHIRARYAAEVTMVDTWFGHLLARLESLGIADETLIIFQADHGTCFDGPGDQGFINKLPQADSTGVLLRGSRRQVPPIRDFPLSQHAARIPLLIRLPDQRQQKRVKAIVQPWDLTATILDAFGVPAPDRVIGRSLLPLVAGGGRAHRTVAVLGDCHRQPDSDTGYVQAMDGTWSYTAWRGSRKPALHHMQQDPQTPSQRSNPRTLT